MRLAFFDLAERAPNDFASLEFYHAWSAIWAAERMEGGDALALRMYDTLIAAGYAPPGGVPDDFLRWDHARLLVQGGQNERARVRLEGVIDPQAIMTLRINRLYDPLRSDPAFEQRLDVVAASEASIARARRILANQPRRLAVIIALARALRDVGRSEEALAEVDRALPAAQGPTAANFFDDIEDQLNWLLNAKADLLYDLGRNDEARGIYNEAMSAGLDGRVNPNQTISFAAMLNAEGRGADALQVLRTIARLPAYGDMWLQAERVCAAEQVGDRGVRDGALAMLRSHETENVSALSQALLCVNDMDGAAALMIRRLANPKQRELALLALQRYQHMQTRRMPHEIIELERIAVLRERSDVQAAVARVGGIEASSLYAN